MPAYLTLDLDQIVVDETLARRLPPGLAAYYLALPIGSEDGRVSMAMVHPENDAALVLLGALLAAPIVPVRATEAAIRQALARLTSTASTGQPRVLVWAAQPEQLHAAREIATLFARASNAAVTTLATAALNLREVTTIAREGAYDLAIIATPAEASPLQLWAEVETPLILLGAQPVALRRILVVLRGYSADCHALEWLAPLLQPETAVTLLPLSPPATEGTQAGLSLRGPQHVHLEECLQHEALRDVSVSVSFRQGPATEQVVAEARRGAYDLVVIAAEGYGHFVASVLAKLEADGGSCRLSYFILRPPSHGPSRQAEAERG
jgi:hypothetical protein